MPQNRIGTIALATATMLAAGLLLAACGGSSSPSGSDASGADSPLKFAKCMREHGVKNFPNPETTAGGATKLTFKAEGTSPKTMEAAQEACRHFEEEGGPQEREVSPQEKVEREEAVQKFAKCMREHGIEIEASSSSGGIQVQIHPGGGGGGPNPESPAFQEAQETCQHLMPGPKGGAGFHSDKAPSGGGATQGFSMESAPAE
jgi:hypothetical protein